MYGQLSQAARRFVLCPPTAQIESKIKRNALKDYAKPVFGIVTVIGTLYFVTNMN